MSAINPSIPALRGIELPGLPAAMEAALPERDGKRLLLTGLSWEYYRRISDAFTGLRVRITYDRGRLEIVVTSWIHERWDELLAMFVRVLADAVGRTYCSGGRATLEREDLDRSIEPDHCFYLEHEPIVRAKSELDLSIDPPPDLAIETEVSRRAIKQLPIYEALRVPEVWRSDGKRISFHVLQDGKYVVAERSRSFPFLRAEDLLPFLQRWGQTDEGTLIREFREWVRLQLNQQRPK